MKDYSIFNAEDFAHDVAFLKWVKYPERYPFLDQFWQQWLLANPGKKDEVDEARLMILAIAHERKHKPAVGKQQEIWRRINESIDESSANPSVPLWQRWYSKAAVVLLIVGMGFFGWYEYNSPDVDKEKAIVHELFLEKKVNHTSFPKTVILSDETSVVLQPNSFLEYPATFSKEIREVYLTGEAFFEVKKDSRRPFLVHAGEIVTRVLGTSFIIRNYIEENNVLVQVKTGKVSVFKEKQSDTSIKEQEAAVEGVVLMPNQQVVYEREEMKMTKSLVKNPSVLTTADKMEFKFRDTPIKEVFSAIEQAYGVEIVYDEEALSTCNLNASLAEIPLYEKLNLICKAIHATYEVIDSHIIIYGKGCSEF